MEEQPLVEEGSVGVTQAEGPSPNVVPNTIQEACFSFFEQNWKLLDTITIKSEVEFTEVLCIKSNTLHLTLKHQLKRVRSQSLAQSFFEFVPEAVWELLVVAVNRNLSIGTTSAKRQDSRRKCTSVLELKRFYGLWMAVESTHGNNTRSLREHYKLIVDMFGKVPSLGMDRFSTLLSALAPSTDELKTIADLLHETFMAHIDAENVSKIFSFYLFFLSNLLI